MSFSDVFTHGNLVDIDISMWTGEKRLTYEDLGLTEESITDSFSLGRKKLIPAHVLKEMRHYDNLARNTLLHHSFPFAFGGARFIPKKNFMKFAEEMEKIIEKFNQLADDLADHYLDYQASMKEEYTKIASEAYKRYRKLNKKVDDTSFISRYKYVKEFLERVQKSYPSVDNIRSRFNMSYVVFQISLPDLSRANYEDMIQEDQKIKLMEKAYKRTLQKKVEEFVESSVSNLRSKAETVLRRLSNNLKNNKKINESSMRTIGNLIEEYERMDFVGDDKIINLIKDFKKAWIDPYTAKKVLDSKTLQKSILSQLKILLEAVTDSYGIYELSKEYRKKVGM